MKVVLDFLLARTSRYWNFLSFVQYYKNVIFIKIYNVKNYFHRLKRHFIELKALSRASLGDILLTLVITAIFFCISKVMGFDISNQESIANSYNETLITIAGLCGVIFGLYYAAIVSLGTTVYARLPKTARELLATEPGGSVFLRLLSFIVFLCVVLLTSQFLGFEKNIISIYFVLLLTGIALFGLSRIGTRLFFFTDPTLLASSSSRLLLDTFEESKSGSFQWDNPSFQTHFSNKAKTAISTLSTLREIAKTNNELKSESLVQLSNVLVGTITRYQKLKRSIPGGSHWYKSKYAHKNWYETSDIVLQISNSTGFIQPDEIKSYMWIEEELMDTFIDCIQENIIPFRHSSLIGCINSLETVLKSLIENNEVEFVLKFLRRLRKVIVPQISNRDFINTHSEKLNYLMDVLEHFGALETKVILMFLENLNKYDPDVLGEKVLAINWKRKQTLYSNDIPIYLHAKLQNLYTLIQFEIITEKRVVSPRWYIETLISQDAIRKLSTDIEAIFKYFNEKDVPKIDVQSFWNDAILVDRQFEQILKLETLIEDIEKIVTKLNSHRKIKDLPWTTIEAAPLYESVNKKKVQVLMAMSNLGGILSVLERSSDIPDYSGKFLHHTGNYILEEMKKNHLETAIFQHYFDCSLLFFEKMRKEHSDDPSWVKEQKLHMAVAPIIDLMTVSGYGLLVSEFYGTTDVWDKVRNIWNAYLSTHPKERLTIIAAIHKWPENSLATLPHRGMLRSSWLESIRDFFESKIEVREESYQEQGAYGFSQRTVVEHSSGLVKLFLSRGIAYNSVEGNDIFIDLYLRKYPEAANLIFSHNQDNLRERLESLNETGIDEDDD